MKIDQQKCIIARYDPSIIYAVELHKILVKTNGGVMACAYASVVHG
jgi:hypothetical protein